MASRSRVASRSRTSVSRRCRPPSGRWRRSAPWPRAAPAEADRSRDDRSCPGSRSRRNSGRRTAARAHREYACLRLRRQLRRVLEWKGRDVVHVINITDVGHLTSDLDVGEDKVELASTREQRSVWDIAAHYTDALVNDLGELRVRTPSTWARAAEKIEQMIAFALTLEARAARTARDGALLRHRQGQRNTASSRGATSPLRAGDAVRSVLVGDDADLPGVRDGFGDLGR